MHSTSRTCGNRRRSEALSATMEAMTGFPHGVVAEIEPGDKSQLPGQVAADDDAVAGLEALARLVVVPLAAVVPALAHATSGEFLRLHARRLVTEQRGRLPRGHRQ